MPPNEIIQFNIRLPEYYERKLRIWARIKRTSRAGLAQNTLQARIEANLPFIAEAVAELARLEGCSPEEMEELLLSDED